MEQKYFNRFGIEIYKAGSCLSINTKYLKYSSVGQMAYLSVFGKKIYKKAGNAFYLFGLAFNGYKDGKRKLVRIVY